MSKENLFTKKKLDTKNIKITAINISGRNLITGDDKGNLTIYEIKKNQLNIITEKKLNSKIEKICVPKASKIAFILSGGDIYFTNLPKGDTIQSLFNSNYIANIFLNMEEKKFENMFLILNKKSKVEIKIYEYDIDEGKANIKEKKFSKDLYIDGIPDCGIWTEKNYFIFSLNQKKTLWLQCDNGKIISEDGFEGAIDIFYLNNLVAISSSIYTLFQKDGNTAYSMLLHPNSDFHCFCEFKNHKIALYDTNITIYKPGPTQFDLVESIDFDKGESGKYMVASKYKLIVITLSGNNINIIDFQEKPLEEQIKTFIDKKSYDKGMEFFVDNTPEDEDDRIIKMENFFLDCGWACLEGDKKDYQNAIKYLGLSDFNPFEFIYMFYDALNIKIFHKDKEADIKKTENQFFKKNADQKEQNKAFEFLISILKVKRDYILEKLIKLESKSESREINFMSSNRSKINLKDSKTEITIGDTFYAINTTLIKCMIKLRSEPKEIENILEDETLNYTNFDGFTEDPFFSDEKNKNLNETKFTLCYISEKNGKNYKDALNQWKAFGEGNDEKYKLIGKDRTKKLFYKFKNERSLEREEKEKLFKEYIIWLLNKYPEEAFEVERKAEIVSNQIFMDEIIPKIETNKKEDLKEKYLEYCNKEQKTEIYQTLLLKLYADKIFALTKKEIKPKKIEGDVKKYYDLFNSIIKSENNVYNKKDILEYIENSWLQEAIIYLYSQVRELYKALDILFKEAKKTKDFKPVEEFCKNNNDNQKEKLFERFYHLLSKEVKEYQYIINQNLEKLEKLKKNSDKNNSEISQEITKFEKEIEENENNKKPFEQEMLEILKNYGSIDNIDPMNALDDVNDHLNICKSKEFFNYLMNIVKDFTIEGNKYKISKKLGEIGLAYKAKEEYEFKNKYVVIDSDRTCERCRKKIGNTMFLVYPNLKVYHSKCAPNIHIDPKTGVDFSKSDCIV